MPKYVLKENIYQLSKSIPEPEGVLFTYKEIKAIFNCVAKRGEEVKTKDMFFVTKSGFTIDKSYVKECQNKGGKLSDAEFQSLANRGPNRMTNDQLAMFRRSTRIGSDFLYRIVKEQAKRGLLRENDPKKWGMNGYPKEKSIKDLIISDRTKEEDENSGGGWK